MAGKRFRYSSLSPACRSGRLLISIDPREMALFRFLLEGYDNLAQFTVLEPRTASVCLLFSPHQEETVRQALEAMQELLAFNIQDWPFSA